MIAMGVSTRVKAACRPAPSLFVPTTPAHSYAPDGIAGLRKFPRKTVARGKCGGTARGLHLSLFGRLQMFTPCPHRNAILPPTGWRAADHREPIFCASIRTSIQEALDRSFRLFPFVFEGQLPCVPCTPAGSIRSY